MINKLNYILALVIFAILQGCGDGGSSFVSGSSGVFVDSNVAGLSYTTSSGLSGVTDAHGGYRYNKGDTVTFSIGGITIGSCRATSHVTPMSIFPGNIEAAINLAQFLQSVDSDGDPSNGITPSEEATDALANVDNFDFENSNFDTLLQSNLPNGLNFVEDGPAMRHMEESFAELNINPDGSEHIIENRVFVGGDTTYGFELWTTDGTKENSTFVKELVEGGTLSSEPDDFTQVGEKIFFTSNDGIHGNELWVSDGTASGTVMVKDIAIGTDNSNPRYLTSVGNICYFVAKTDENGSELWKSDGTESGTVMVKDINPGSNDSNVQNLIAFNNTLFFMAHTDENGYELWKSDGTSNGTILIKDIYAGASSSYPRNFAIANNTLFFTAKSAEYGQELWKTDGTANGTVLVKDIEVGSGNSYPSDLTVVGDTLFFTAEDEAMYGLWKSDGTSAHTVKVKEWDLSNPNSLMAFKNKLYFAGNDETFGRELWVSDGTSSGTTMVKDIYAGENSGGIYNLVATNNKLFFRAKSSSNSGIELWQSEGTSETTKKVVDENNNTIKSANSLIAIGDILFFRNRTDNTGYELWKSDGISSGTSLVKDIYVGKNDSYPRNFFKINNTLYFTADNGVHGDELWKSDGTTTGTILFKDINKQPKSSLNPDTQFFKVGDKYYFKREKTLWVSDGTEAGTIALDTDLIDFENSIVFSEKFVYFVYTDESYRLKLTDGTIEGTTTIYSGYIASDTLTTNSTNIYFSAKEKEQDGYSGYKIHKSNGSADGTSVLTKNDGTDFEGPNYLTISGENLFFMNFKGPGAEQLYAINTTTNIATVLSDEGALYARYLTDVNGTLFFRGTNDANGSELWKSDGTVTGTVLVKNIVSDGEGTGSSNPKSFVNVNGTLYFTASDELGRELWKSDGSSNGTVMVKDIIEGSSSSSPRMLAVVDNKLYFSSYEDKKDKVLWVTYQDRNITQRVDLNISMSDYYFNSTYSEKVPHYKDYLLLWLNGRNNNYDHHLLKKITGSISETFQDVTLTIGDEEK